MTIETEAQLQALRIIGRIVADCLQYMMAAAEPGMTTAELDAIGAEFLERHGARSAPVLTYKFPGATCISVEPEIAHGIPGPRRLLPGQLVNIDVSAEKDGFFADTGGSMIVPPATKPKERLLAAVKEALASAITVARAERPINGIGGAIEAVARKRGLTIIRNLGSHGVGAALHEAPEFIPGYFEERDRRKLKAGQVITIEPFLSTGATLAAEAGDGWTLFATGGELSAQFEHTMVITNDLPLIMTMPSTAGNL